MSKQKKESQKVIKKKVKYAKVENGVITQIDCNAREKEGFTEVDPSCFCGMIYNESNNKFEKPSLTEEQQKQKKVQDWKRITNKALNAIEVNYKGVVYQGDKESQTAILKKITVMDSNSTVAWRAKDNNPYKLKKADLKVILTEAQNQEQALLFDDYPG